MAEGKRVIDLTAAAVQGGEEVYAVQAGADVKLTLGAAAGKAVGAGADDVAAGNHHHDASYATVTHTHDGSYAALIHSHAISNVTNLQSELDARGKMAAAQTWTKPQRLAVGTVTHAASVALDLSDKQDWDWTLTGNATLANPASMVAGHYGTIVLTQDATGGRTLAFGSAWKFADGSVPSLSTAANAVDELYYRVRADGTISAALAKDIK